MLIDTHAHLNFKELQELGIAEILNQAKQNKVNLIINPGTNQDTNLQSLELAKKYHPIYAAMGFHPHDADIFKEAYLEEFYTIAKQEAKVIAIGEIGLDYFKQRVDKDSQIKVFKAMLSLSKELNLPYILHNREASLDLLSIIKELNYYNGVVHCFSYDLDIANAFLELGLMLSFTGIITFKSSQLAKVIELVPLSKIMLETDAPFLAPDPFRGKINKPSYLPLIAEKIAFLKKVSQDSVEENTTKNALRFFSKIKI